MTHSLAEQANLTCSHCHQPFTYDMWLIVDTDERPDLLVLVQAGRLHHVTCPNCGAELGEGDSPLLIYRPDSEPVILFSPAQQTSPEEDGEHFQGLLGILQEQSKANWTYKWLQANVQVVPRPMLPMRLGTMSEAEILAALEAGSEEEDKIPDKREMEHGRVVLIRQFVAQETWLGSYQFAREYPQLLDEVTQQVLQILIAKAQSAGYEEDVQVLAEHLTLLQACREQGLAEAFAAKLDMASTDELEMALMEESIPIEVRRLLEELVQSGANSPANLERVLAGHPDLQAKLAQTMGMPRPRQSELEVTPTLQLLIDEIDQLNRPQEIPRKIALLEQALYQVVRESNPLLWAALQVSLGNSLQQNLVADMVDNLERAIQLYEQALQVMTRTAMPAEWAAITMNLANVYQTRIRGERADNLEQAIQLYEQALQVRTRTAMPIEWAETTNNLANAYRNRIMGERVDNLEQAIQLYEQVLQVRTRTTMPTKWAETTANLANAYHDRIKGERVDNLKQTIQLCEQALEIFTLADRTADHQKVQGYLGHLYFGEGRWIETVAAYQGAIEANELLLVSALSRKGQLAEVVETEDIFPRTAYGLLQLGRYGEALVQLDGGKARLLAQAVGQEEANLALLTGKEQELFTGTREQFRILQAERQLPEGSAGRRPTTELAPLQEAALDSLNDLIAQLRAAHPDFMPKGLDLPDLLAIIPVGGALIAPVVTSRSGGVMVVPHGVAEVTVDNYLPLPELTEKRVSAWVIGTEEAPGWLKIYLNFINNRSTTLVGWDIVLADVTAQLLTPIQAKLATLGVGHGAELLLMPQGRLGLLPLHAPWVDSYIVRYVPSGYTAQAGQRRLGEGGSLFREPASLLAVINPNPDPTRNLLFASYEGATIARLFTGREKSLLNESAATRQAVLNQLAEHDYLHFSCHGNFGWGNVDESGLWLANEEQLTLRDILTHRLRPARLVTLSACETGITDWKKAADEFVGLPTAFLQAGAVGVVSTLWAVDDLSTSLLMEQFYRLHLAGMDPAPALRAAQVWLRDVTAGELANRFDGESQQLMTRLTEEEALAYWYRFERMDKEKRPFADPYYWATFTFTGA